MAVDLYRREFQAEQGGKIGVTLVSTSPCVALEHAADSVRPPSSYRTATGVSRLMTPSKPSGVRSGDWIRRWAGMRTPSVGRVCWEVSNRGC